MDTKHIPQLLIEQIVDSAAGIAKTLLPIVYERQRLNNDINSKIIDVLTKHRDIVNEAISNSQRRLKSNSDDDSKETTNLDATTNKYTSAELDAFIENTRQALEPFMAGPASSAPKHEDNSPKTTFPVYFTVDVGRAFAGDEYNTVVVPVTSKPYLHQSQEGKWSWRTTVAGHSDYRHINVSNYAATLADQNGNYYAKVDKTWKTDQVVFKDYCNG